MQRLPIVAVGLFAAGSRYHLPAAIDLDALENIDARHALLSNRQHHRQHDGKLIES